MSHCGILEVINVRLYDIQDLKTDIRKKITAEFYSTNPWQVR